MPTPPTTPDFQEAVLAALGIDQDHLPTLHSVLEVHERCEREAELEPTRAAGSFPRRVPLPMTVQQAMVRAAESRTPVVLSIDGYPDNHTCVVSRGFRGSPAVFHVEPGLPDDGFEFVRTNIDGRLHNPLVTSCDAAPAARYEPAPQGKLTIAGLDSPCTPEIEARSKSAPPEEPDRQAAARWVGASIPAEHVRLAAMIDAGGDVSEVIGQWAGELAVAAHLAGQALAIKPAQPVSAPFVVGVRGFELPETQRFGVTTHVGPAYTPPVPEQPLPPGTVVSHEMANRVSNSEPST